jgi:alanine racemase
VNLSETWPTNLPTHLLAQNLPAKLHPFEELPVPLPQERVWVESDLASLRQKRAWVEIDLAALRHNVRAFKRCLRPETDLLAVVKADAYGHGAIAVAQAALQSGATWLGVATLTEGIELRRSGLMAPILLLGATHCPDEVQAIVRWNIQPTVASLEQALLFSQTLESLGKRLPVHLTLDTGMSRLGMPWQEATAFVDCIRQLPQLQIASIYSHFATADDPDPTVMRQQHQRYEAAIAAIRAQGFEPPRLHLANTAATLVDPALHYDMVRVGLGLYGLYPAPHLADALDLQPVLRVKARVTQVKDIAAGTGVSYGHRFVAPRDMRMAVIGIGYADGVQRNLSGQLEVLVEGRRLPQIGSITMDQMMLDISTLPHLVAGDVVTLLGTSGGDRLTAENWADTLGTISWEILCGFKHRLPRVVVDPS